MANADELVIENNAATQNNNLNESSEYGEDFDGLQLHNPNASMIFRSHERRADTAFVKQASDIGYSPRPQSNAIRKSFEAN